MHEVIISSSALSQIFSDEAVASRYGSSPIGQTSTHLAHRRHGPGLWRRASRPLRIVILLDPFTIGVSSEIRALPIIGPPDRTLFSLTGSPPQASINRQAGVPNLTMKLPGLASSLPVTVV